MPDFPTWSEAKIIAFAQAYRESPLSTREVCEAYGTSTSRIPVLRAAYPDLFPARRGKRDNASRNDEIRALYANRVAPTEIAETLIAKGYAVTVEDVLYVAMRSGLRRAQIVGRGGPQKVRKQAPPAETATDVRDRGAHLRNRADLVALEQLKLRQCRFPLGNGPFLFCGQPTTSELSSWCADCRRIVYRPAGAAPYVSPAVQ